MSQTLGGLKIPKKALSKFWGFSFRMGFFGGLSSPVCIFKCKSNCVLQNIWVVCCSHCIHSILHHRKLIESVGHANIAVFDYSFYWFIITHNFKFFMWSKLMWNHFWGNIKTNEYYLSIIYPILFLCRLFWFSSVPSGQILRSTYG